MPAVAISRLRAAEWRKSLRFLALVTLSAAGAALLIAVVVQGPSRDFRAYWGFNPSDPYSGVLGTPSAFLYSPVAGLTALPLHLLPFGVARLLWLALELACLVYLLGPWALAALLFVPILADLYWGNIQLLVGVAIVIGFRYPAAWALMLLTKVTPGVGLLWFAVRREWRQLGIALVVTLALAVVSGVVVPSWWPGWIRTLLGSTSLTAPPGLALGIPLWPRLVLAAGITAWAARRGDRWLLPFAVMLATPAIWLLTPAVLAAVPRLLTAHDHVPVVSTFRREGPPVIP